MRAAKSCISFALYSEVAPQYKSSPAYTYREHVRSTIQSFFLEGVGSVVMASAIKVPPNFKQLLRQAPEHEISLIFYGTNFASLTTIANV
jgi:hypothetical protein